MAEFFHTALHGDITRRYASAEEMRSAFLRIRKLGGPPMTPPAPQPEPEPSTPEPGSARIESVADFSDQVIAYSGKKNTISRRYVQHALGKAERELADPFSPATGYAAVLDSSVQRIHQLPSELPEKWSDSADLVEVFDRLAESVTATVRSLGGIATPAQLSQSVTAVLSRDAAGQTPRLQQGVLRLVELYLNRNGTVIHPSRRGRHHALVAFATDETLSRLPKALEDAAVDLIRTAGAPLIPADQLQNALTQAASEYLDVTVTHLPISASLLPELATFRSARVSLTSSGELYAPDIDLASMLREVIHPSTKTITPALLKRSLATRFPDADHALPKTPELAELLAEIAPDFRWDDNQHKFLRREEIATTGVETRLPTRTVYHGARPLSEVDPALRDLFAGLEPTMTSRDFRVVSTPLGTTQDVVTALKNQFSAEHVDLADEILNDLYQRMAASDQAEKFDTLLGLDNDESRVDLTLIVRDAADNTLANAERLDAPAVILTDVSILARFDSLDLLARWTDIATGANTRALWLVLPHEGADGQNVSVDGRSLPLTSPSQILTVAQPTS